MGELPLDSKVAILDSAELGGEWSMNVDAARKRLAALKLRAANAPVTRQLDQAIADYNVVIRLKPDDALAFYNRGIAYDDKEQYDEAIASYDEAIRRDPKHVFALANRGYTLSKKRLYDRAIEDFNAALRLSPNETSVLQNRGFAYSEKGQYDQAIADFNKALSLDPNDSTTLVERGRAYRRKGLLDNAIEDFTNAIRLNLDDAEAFRGRGIAFRQKGLHKRALDDFDAAIRRDSNNSFFYYSRGVERFYLGQFDLAREDLSRAIELKPDYIYSALWFYLAQSRAGKDGKKDLKRNTRQLNLSSWPGHIVGLYLAVSTSEEILKAAKDLDPKKDREQHCEAYFYLGEYALLRGNRNEAARLLRAAIDTGVTNFVEYSGAQAELKRLSQ